MEQGSYIGQLLTVVFFLIVGVRLLRLGRRTGEAPEKLLGLHFFAKGLAYLGWNIPAIFALEEIRTLINFEIWFDLVPWAVFGVGMVPMMLFVRVVFRPDAAWAKFLVTTLALLLFSATTMWFVQSADFYSIENPWFWCEWLGYTTTYLWVTVEAFLAYSRARRRERIGLCDPVVANRYLLFAASGTATTIGCFVDLVETRGFSFYQTASTQIDLAYLIVESTGILMLFLVFFPPAFYRRWIAAEPKAEVVDG